MAVEYCYLQRTSLSAGWVKMTQVGTSVAACLRVCWMNQTLARNMRMNTMVYSEKMADTDFQSGSSDPHSVTIPVSGAL